MSDINRRTFTTAAAMTLTGTAALAATPRRTVIKAFASRHVEARDIEVWVPPVEPGQRLRVLYAHDGQNLFDGASSYSGVSWELDKAMTRLAAGGVEPAIIVAIANSPARAREYQAGGALAFFDAATADAIRRSCGGELLSDAYLRFIVEELKPHIDARFPTRTGADATFTMGASMGGLVSLEALRAHPQVFGGAGCLSAHTLLFGPGAANDPNLRPPANAGDQIEAGLRAYAAQAFPAPDGHRLWIDRGSEELDALYGRSQDAFIDGLRQRGYTQGRHLEARVFERTGHHERWWAARAETVLRFLLA